MAVTVVEKMNESRTFKHSWPNVREYSQVYRVLTDDPDTGPYAVRFAAGIPLLGDAYPDDSGAACKDVSPVPVGDDGQVWEVTVTYSSQLPPLEDDPLLRPPVFSYGAQEIQRIVTKDRNGAAIVNPAGEVYDPPLEESVYWQVLTVVKNFADFSPAIFDDYSNKVNKFPWFGCAKRTVFLKPVLSPGKSFENGVYYWPVHFEFTYRPEGWDHKLLSQGYYKKSGSEPELITDKKGMPVNKPVLLDSSGAPLAIGGTPHFKTWETKDEADFHDLGLV